MDSWLETSPRLRQNLATLDTFLRLSVCSLSDDKGMTGVLRYGTEKIGGRAGAPEESPIIAIHVNITCESKSMNLFE